ncbi:MAG: DeoR/GlpR family DNA-binding transcription regulator [Athalassotoga sp.]|uniref:DeoR/GlpR family DNA-binding transcription regulator n=2 Tax=Athalassotoga sp. TaxID=2022597 RepID=UPI003D000435
MDHKLFKRERWNRILELVNERDFLSIDEMKKLLNVSEITIRRDMKELNDRALVQKVYGGIKKIDSNPPEAQFAQRRMSHANEKALIAKLAIEFVEDGDTIFIDASSTTFEFAKVCREKRNNLHVVTSSLVTALELIKNPTNTVTLIGGIIRADNMSVIGTTAEKMVEDLNVEKAFISCRTFEPDEGTFETNPSESVIKRKMADNSNKVYLLVDSSKLFKKATFLTVPVEKINAVITDGKVDELINVLPKKVKVVHGV